MEKEHLTKKHMMEMVNMWGGKPSLVQLQFCFLLGGMNEQSKRGGERVERETPFEEGGRRAIDEQWLVLFFAQTTRMV